MSATTPNPAVDFATFLAGAVTFPDPPSGSKTLTAGTNLFQGPMREPDAAMPIEAVFVQTVGGMSPEPYLGNSREYSRGAVVVYVRSALDAFTTGEALARGILRKLQRAAVPNYVLVLAQTSEPVFLGEDERGSFRWSITFTATWDR